MKIEVLHIIPTHVLSSEIYGSYKDVWGRKQYFIDSNFNYQTVAIESDDRYEDVLGNITLKPTHIFIEYSYYRKLVRGIRKKYPNARLAIRAHNLEAMQHYDNYGLKNPNGILWLLYGMARYFYADLVCKIQADYIYPISEWEAKKYWRYIPGKARVVWLPYFSPNFTITEFMQISNERNIIACLPTSNENRKSKDLVNRFIEFSKIAKEASYQTSRFRYVITGDLSSWSIGRSNYVEYAGMIECLGEFMRRVRVVCLLSPLGYGFKTTITDAVTSGCRVILAKKLYRRLPLELKSACIPIDNISLECVNEVVAEIQKNKQVNDVGEKLKCKSLSILTDEFIYNDQRN